MNFYAHTKTKPDDLIHLRYKFLSGLQLAIQVVFGPGDGNVVAGKPVFKLPSLHPCQVGSLGNTDLARGVQLSRKANSNLHVGRKVLVENFKEFVWNGKIHNVQYMDKRAEIKLQWGRALKARINSDGNNFYALDSASMGPLCMQFLSDGFFLAYRHNKYL
jgi:hypothetical protein